MCRASRAHCDERVARAAQKRDTARHDLFPVPKCKGLTARRVVTQQVECGLYTIHSSH